AERLAIQPGRQDRSLQPNSGGASSALQNALPQIQLLVPEPLNAAGPPEALHAVRRRNHNHVPRCDLVWRSGHLRSAMAPPQKTRAKLSLGIVRNVCRAFHVRSAIVRCRATTKPCPDAPERRYEHLCADRT